MSYLTVKNVNADPVREALGSIQLEPTATPDGHIFEDVIGITLPQLTTQTVHPPVLEYHPEVSPYPIITTVVTFKRGSGMVGSMADTAARLFDPDKSS